MPLRRQATVELVAWGLVGGFWVASSLLGWPLGVGIAAIAIAVVAYGALTFRNSRENLRDFGLRIDNLRRAAPPILGFTLAVALVEVGIAIATGRAVPTKQLAMMLILYPVWGVAQQLVIQGIVHRRLRVIWSSTPGCIGVTALAFALLHVRSPLLFALTFGAGLAWSWLFSRWPNVWLLGLSHGVLAALAYPLLLGETPLG